MENYRVVNIVITTQFCGSLNLFRIKHGTFNPMRFAGRIIKTRFKSQLDSRRRLCCVLFHNGKATILGIQSEAQIRPACQYFCKLLNCETFSTPTLQTVTACFKTLHLLDLHKLKSVDCKVGLEPELIACAHVRRDGVTFSVWRSGSVICAGAKSAIQASNACVSFVKELQKFPRVQRAKMLKSRLYVGESADIPASSGTAPAPIILNADTVGAAVELPFTLIAAGVSGVGKTHFVHRLLTTLGAIKPAPSRIIIHHGSAYQDVFDQYPSWVEFRKGYDGAPLEENAVHVFDDLLGDIEQHSKVLQDAFTKGRHHSGISVIYIVQNIFPKSEKGFRTMSLNSQYIVLFQQSRDVLQIQTLARQMRPGETKFFMSAYLDAVSVPFNYLFLDFKPTTPSDQRISTFIFPEERRIYYLP